MSRVFLYVLIALLSFNNAVRLFGAELDGNRLQVEIVTIEPGPELFERWGHILIVVFDRQEGTRKAYNFGTYNFNDPELLLRYARGFLDFYLSVSNRESKIRQYASRNRGMVSRILNLTPEQTLKVAALLESNALPENRTYAYRHYLDNCCTRIRDLLDQTLGGAIRSKFDNAPTGRSYRYHTYRALEGMPVMQNLLCLFLGRGTDRPITRWDEQFLPEIFGRDLDKITVSPGNTPLVAQKRVLHDPGKPVKASLWEAGSAAAAIVVLVFGFGLHLALYKKGRRWTRRTAGLGLFLWGFIAGFAGLILILFWTGTTHYDSHNNENVLVFPFTHLWLTGPGLVLLLRGKLGLKTNLLLQKYLIVSLSLLGISLLLKLGPFYQDNAWFIAFAAVWNILSYFSLRLMAKEPAAGLVAETEGRQKQE